MRILFQVLATPFLRHFTDVVLTLAERGHHIQVAYSENPPDLPPPSALKGHERITFLQAPAGRHDAWAVAVDEMRALRDYLRYLDEPFAHAEKLRHRALRKTIKVMSGGVHRHLAVHCPRCEARLVDDDVVLALRRKYPEAAGTLANRLEQIETLIPTDKQIDGFLRSIEPDVVLVTPLLRTGSQQAEYVKSARALGVPVGFPVFSWDNLSTKGLLHVQPERVFVWNQRQKAEAIELHQVDESRVVITGAPRFDRFFTMSPSVDRESFCAGLGLDPHCPVLVYLCSSEFVAEVERDFVVRWIDEIRREPSLEPCNVVVRPHPRQKGQWQHFEIGRPRVAVSWPRSVSSEQSLFDTLFHGSAVVGLNTSALLEAAIVGRPVLTVLAPEFAGGQTQTLHFGYLLREQGGFVEFAPDMPAHRQQLAAAVAGRYDAERIQAFVESFLRPHGRHQPASPLMADAIEALAGAKDRQSWWSRVPGRRMRRSSSQSLPRDTAADEG